MSFILPRCTKLEIKRCLCLCGLLAFKDILISSQVSTPSSTTRVDSLPPTCNWSISTRWPGITQSAWGNLRLLCCRDWGSVFIPGTAVIMHALLLVYFCRFINNPVDICSLDKAQSKAFHILHLWLHIGVSLMLRDDPFSPLASFCTIWTCPIYHAVIPQQKQLWQLSSSLCHECPCLHLHCHSCHQSSCSLSVSPSLVSSSSCSMLSVFCNLHTFMH